MSRFVVFGAYGPDTRFLLLLGRVRQAGVNSWCSEGIHRHFSFGGVEVDWIVWCDDGPSDGATAAIAAVKPCAFGAPLRGCGA